MTYSAGRASNGQTMNCSAWRIQHSFGWLLIGQHDGGMASIEQQHLLAPLLQSSLIHDSKLTLTSKHTCRAGLTLEALHVAFHADVQQWHFMSPETAACRVNWPIGKGFAGTWKSKHSLVPYSSGFIKPSLHT